MSRNKSVTKSVIANINMLGESLGVEQEKPKQQAAPQKPEVSQASEPQKEAEAKKETQNEEPPYPMIKIKFRKNDMPSHLL